MFFSISRGCLLLSMFLSGNYGTFNVHIFHPTNMINSKLIDKQTCKFVFYTFSAQLEYGNATENIRFALAFRLLCVKTVSSFRLAFFFSSFLKFVSLSGDTSLMKRIKNFSFIFQTILLSRFETILYVQRLSLYCATIIDLVAFLFVLGSCEENDSLICSQTENEINDSKYFCKHCVNYAK